MTDARVPETSAENAARGASVSSAPERKLNLRRLEKLQRWLQYGATAVLVVFVALIAFSGYKLRQINRDIDARQVVLADTSARLEERQREYAAISEKLRETQQRLDSSIKVFNQYLEINKDTDEKEERELEEAIAETAKESGATAIPPRVYIHIVREDQRQRARQIAERLQAAGFVTPGIENVSKFWRGQSDLRHFHNSSEGRDIEIINGVLREMGIAVKVLPELRNANVRPRHYELWLGEEF